MPSIVILTFALLLQAPQAPTLKYDMPEGWTSKPASSRMRVAEFVLPKVAGDTEDATLVITYFGGQGGTVQANFDRWLTQMTQPDGRGEDLHSGHQRPDPHDHGSPRHLRRGGGARFE